MKMHSFGQGRLQLAFLDDCRVAISNGFTSFAPVLPGVVLSSFMHGGNA
ncbi:MAG: hypothetical protein OEV15_03430 [Gallionella sp.]|nr:hypothetical protein [Gallionella sp.]